MNGITLVIISDYITTFIRNLSNQLLFHLQARFSVVTDIQYSSYFLVIIFIYFNSVQFLFGTLIILRCVLSRIAFNSRFCSPWGRERFYMYRIVSEDASFFPHFLSRHLYEALFHFCALLLNQLNRICVDQL